MNPRRIMEHARKLGWPAIGIELVIVIVGVFIGLQVSNWNVERAVDALSGRFERGAPGQCLMNERDRDMPHAYPGCH